MNHCPNCNGTGKQKYSFQEFGKPAQMMEMDCMYCKGGTKPMNALDALRHNLNKERMNALWCKCEDNGHRVTYVPDNVSDKCRKHHWTCNDCGKIAQVG